MHLSRVLAQPAMLDRREEQLREQQPRDEFDRRDDGGDRDGRSVRGVALQDIQNAFVAERARNENEQAGG